MTNTWLIRRLVRSPPTFAVMLRINSSVCKLPFISIYAPSAAWMSSTPFAAAASLSRERQQSLKPEHPSPHLLAVSLIFPSGPTSVGRIMPAVALSDDAAQRGFIAGMHNNRRRRRHRLSCSDQTVILAEGAARFLNSANIAFMVWLRSPD